MRCLRDFKTALAKVYYFTVGRKASLVRRPTVHFLAERSLFTNCLPFGPRIPGGPGEPGGPLFAFPLSWEIFPVV